MLLVNGCKKKFLTQPNFIVDQQEAKLVDIPIPLYDEKLSMELSESAAEGSAILGYRSPLPIAAVIDFYVHEMERLGWRQLALFQGTESLIQFESPERFCSISIRPSDEKFRQMYTNVIIFVGRKQL